jgi:hypothetical protein
MRTARALDPKPEREQSLVAAIRKVWRAMRRDGCQPNPGWTPPLPVIRKLSALFPDLELRHSYAAEDAAAGGRIVTYRGGTEMKRELLDLEPVGEMHDPDADDQEDGGD